MEEQEDPTQNITKEEYDELCAMKSPHHIPQWKRILVYYIHKILKVNYTPITPSRLNAKGHYWHIKNGQCIKL